MDYLYEDIKIKGVVGKPEIARNNRAYQMFFINNRYIKNATLSAGAEQAFKGLLQIGKFGFLVLNLEIDPSKIDVNVHPAKLEIRFEEEQKVFKAVYNSIKETLLKTELIKNVTIGEEKEDVVSNASSDIRNENEEAGAVGGQEKEEPKIAKKSLGLVGLFKKGVTGSGSHSSVKPLVKEELSNVEEEKILDENNAIAELYNKKNGTIGQEEVGSSVLGNTQKEDTNFDDLYSNTFGIKKEEEKEQIQDANSIELDTLKDLSNITVFEDKEGYMEKQHYKYIGALFSTYIVIEIRNDIYIIDQHAAHERIMYEKVKRNFYSMADKDSQIMLLPDIIELSHKEKDIVNENVDIFEKAGFTFEEFGENTIRLIGVPTICIELDTKELFKEILDEINTVAITALQEKEEKFISTIACKAAVKANMKLTKEEVEELLDKLMALKNPFTCPHGRPTAIKMNKYDIEKKFGRK